MNYVVLRMRNLALGLILIVLFVSCYRKIPTSTQGKIYTKISLTSIKSENLSEEITGNDEIHWMIWLINDSTPLPYVQFEAHDTLSFSKNDLMNGKEIFFEQPISNIKDLYIIVALVESDTEQSSEERISVVRQQLQRVNFHAHDSLQTRLYQNLLDDDLLGISFYKLASLKSEGEFIFSGIHLFDKYYYRVRYELE